MKTRFHFVKSFIIPLLFLLSCGKPAAQTTEFYAGGTYFIESILEDNFWGRMDAGVQLFRWHFLAPEIGYSYQFGSLERQENEVPEDPNLVADYLETRFSSHLFTVGSQLIYGDDTWEFFVLPKMHFGTVSATGEFRERVPGSNNAFSLTEWQEASESLQFFSIVTGMKGGSV